MPIKEYATGIRDLIGKTFDTRVPITFRPTEKLFSEGLSGNSRLHLMQKGYEESIFLKPGEIKNAAADYGVMEEFLNIGYSGFHGPTAMGSLGVCRFLEVFGEVFEGSGNDVSVEMAGIAPLSNERFKVDPQGEPGPLYYPDLLVKSFGEKAFFVEIKYATRVYADFDFDKIDDDRVLFKLKKGDINGYVSASENEGIPTYLAIVTNHIGDKTESVVPGMLLEHKVEADYRPMKIRKSDLLRHTEFINTLSKRFEEV